MCFPAPERTVFPTGMALSNWVLVTLLILLKDAGIDPIHFRQLKGWRVAGNVRRRPFFPGVSSAATP